jgi:hypothetical protein
MAVDNYAGGATPFSRLTVPNDRLNPDLSICQDQLKKARTGKPFIIVGQPDVDIRRVGEGQFQVQIRGLDTCNRLFFVRHAYFLGGDDPLRQTPPRPPRRRRSSVVSSLNVNRLAAVPGAGLGAHSDRGDHPLRGVVLEVYRID